MKKLLLLFVSAWIISSCYSQKFSVSYSEAVFNKPFSGKVYLYLSKTKRNPREGMVILENFPCFALEVKDLQPGKNILFDDRAISYPVKLSDLERGEYYVQAVWDRNLGGRAIWSSPGNMYSSAKKTILTKDVNQITEIVCDKINPPEPEFKESKYLKALKAPSALLTAFHKKPVRVNAAVLLPKEYYDNPARKFPVVFNVFGFGGDYMELSGDSILRSQPMDSLPCITVFLDGNCPGGHSVYANSANNGPWGDALVKEFIPLLEKTYRCDGARLLKGHSSGGWTVLWLQTQYPSVFTGCWSSSPDPVDFGDFQHIDLYAGDNFFYGSDSTLRNVATVAGFFSWATVKQAYQMEQVIDRGEQMHSFDAVFGPKGLDGKPVPICNSLTGELNAQAFENWKKYDISLNLRNNWERLRNELQNKIRISVGEQDNFLLHSSVKKMEKEMKKINAAIKFEYYPGDHFTVHTKEYHAAGNKFLASRYLEWLRKTKRAF